MPIVLYVNCRRIMGGSGIHHDSLVVLKVLKNESKYKIKGFDTIEISRKHYQKPIRFRGIIFLETQQSGGPVYLKLYESKEREEYKKFIEEFKH